MTTITDSKNDNYTLKTLHGWQRFMSAAGYGLANPVLTFAAAMTASENSRKSAKKEIASSLDYVGWDCCRTCRQFGIPLWLAIIPKEAQR